MADLTSPNPRLRSTRDSLRASLSAHLEQAEGSGGESGELEPEVGQSEEGAEGKGVVEVMGGGGGVWRGGEGGGGGRRGGGGGAKPREFSKLLNHSI